MARICNLFGAALSVLTALCLAAPIAAGPTVPHKEQCKGTIVDVLPPGPDDPLPTLLFAGEGRATHFGEYTIEGSNDFDDQGNVLGGQFTTTLGDGSTLSGVYEGTYQAFPDGTARFDVRVKWLKGTGRLKGVTGEADVVAFLDGINPGDAFEYFTDGTLTFPRKRKP